MKAAADKLFHVRPEEDGLTVVAALRKWIAESPSWGDGRRLVRTRRLMVNGNLCLDAGRRLKTRDVVKLLAHPAAPPPKDSDVRIRHLDPHLVVIEKPSGMTSVRHVEERGWTDKRKRWQPTLEDLLPRIIAKKESPGPSKPAIKGEPKYRKQLRPSRTPPIRPVHRLDRDTSGLMVFARTVPAERALGQQFRQHTTQRRYLAIVLGSVEAQTIETQLVRDRGDGRRGSTDEPDVGKRAVTHVRPLEHLDGYTLVECRLETGRTHQIRIHLSELGHPVAGEKVYDKNKFGEPTVDRSGAPRLALHSTELSFEHPHTGRTMHFEMALPPDLEAFLDRLRKKK